MNNLKSILLKFLFFISVFIEAQDINDFEIRFSENKIYAIDLESTSLIDVELRDPLWKFKMFKTSCSDSNYVIEKLTKMNFTLNISEYNKEGIAPFSCKVDSLEQYALRDGRITNSAINKPQSYKNIMKGKLMKNEIIAVDSIEREVGKDQFIALKNKNYWLKNIIFPRYNSILKEFNNRNIINTDTIKLMGELLRTYSAIDKKKL